jgi:multisubunit Na+/H+ antiporter MnhG subunit
MNFDLRLPISLMFSLFGAILTVYGLISGPEIYQRSLGINVNLWWGAALLIFGLLMLFFALRKGGDN